WTTTATSRGSTRRAPASRPKSRTMGQSGSPR
ncbi:MAG: hypothetical protein AVDCRST_MAG28-2948, partial [uncultured Rubrobacteraceae bacterium]